ncbi:MAG TPA: diacylglycerol kinase family protein [Gemmataceae bacterium]|jgi:diacylglycerol kinase (ATP)|nr:diacylglycerol kinase family protein [Gemmataceae bacterium]
MAVAKRIRLIVNPSARSGRGLRSLRRAGLLHERQEAVRLEWVSSRSAEHFHDLVRKAQEEELDALGLAGGDGTVAIALNALDGPNRVPIGLLPTGSGNDFATDVGIPRTLAGAFSVLRHGVPRWLDVVRTLPGSRRYGCVASVGLDALALRIVHGSWLPRSRALNIYASLRALYAYRPRPVRVTWQGGAFQGEVMFVAVTNTRGYAGGFLVNPAARLDDGELNLCIVRRTSRLRLFRQFPRILQGTHGTLPEVTLASSPWMRIEGVEEQLPVALDGELPRTATPVELRCEPAALQVLAPGGE